MSDQTTTPQRRRISARFAKRLGADDGMTTAEYAVGCVASTGFAGILYELLTSDTVAKLLMNAITKGISSFLHFF